MGSINVVNSDNFGCFGLQSLFNPFLLVAIIVVLARIISLALQLWSFRRKREFPGGDMADSTEAIAKAALKGRIQFATKLSDADKINGQAILFKVDCIDARFIYYWETCHARVQSTKTLAVLTVILSFFVAAMDCANIFSGLRHAENVPITAMAGGLLEIFMFLAIGLFISAFFYAASRLFEGTLARRRRDWNYLKARFREEFYSTQPQHD
jgi:biopolymer transport protein ExbB/TolQ